MRVALDVLTPKMAILAHYLRRSLIEEGFEVDIIAREQTQTLAILDILKTPYRVIGRYGGSSLEGKLEADLQRERDLLNYIKQHGKPDVFWSKASVSGFRVAFGLKIPIVCTNDTLHNTPVVKLTVPLVNFLVIPEVYRVSQWTRFGINREKIVRYRGLEEVTWMREIKPDRERIMKSIIGEVVDKLVVIRGVEYKSSYFNGEKVNILEILVKLSNFSTVLFLPRYNEDFKIANNLSNVKIPRKTPFAPELLAIADLVISSGGTMATEAALAGTPVLIYHFWLPTANFLKRRKLPIWYVPNTSRLLEIAKSILKDPEKFKVNTEHLLRQMESPIPKTVNCIKKCL